MKVTLIVVAALVLSLGVVVVIGLSLPKQHVVSRSAAYRASPDQLFSLIAGPQTWRSDVYRYEVIPDTGARELVRETARNGETITYELANRNPPTSIERRIASQNLPYSGWWTFTLQPDGGVTVVRITEHGEVYNPLFRFVSKFILGQTHSIDLYLEALGKATGQKVQIND